MPRAYSSVIRLTALPPPLPASNMSWMGCEKRKLCELETPDEKYALGEYLFTMFFFTAQNVKNINSAIIYSQPGRLSPDLRNLPIPTTAQCIFTAQKVKNIHSAIIYSQCIFTARKV